MKYEIMIPVYVTFEFNEDDDLDTLTQDEINETVRIHIEDCVDALKENDSLIEAIYDTTDIVTEAVSYHVGEKIHKE